MKLPCQLLSPAAKLPTRAHLDDAGLDLYAAENLTLAVGQIVSVKTGCRLALPNGTAGLIWDKSGLAQRGLHCLAGVIDAGYRGEILVTVINLSTKPLTIAAGQKIAQLLIQPIVQVQPEEAIIEDVTARGAKGFGSSGL